MPWEVQLVQPARGLEALAEAADELVRDEWAADVRKDVSLDGDCEEMCVRKWY